MEEKTNFQAEPRKSRLDFSKIQELMLQNVKRTKSKTFTQYTKDLIKTYLTNPYSNIDNIRKVSAFLARTSMIYKKILSYFAQMPLFYYNLTYKADWTKGIDSSKMLKSYMDVSKKLQEIKMQKEFSTVIATALRDGVYYGFVYDGEGDGFLLQGLDPQYCKISGITGDGQYIIAFNASYFDYGNNSEYIYGIDNDGEGVWDQVFIDGYLAYKDQGRDLMWFDLPVERSLCVLADEDAEMPLPYFLPMFISLLDLLDLEQIIASKTELENYKLLVNKIPMINGSEEVNDFAISMEFLDYIKDQQEDAVPSLVGVTYTPCDVDVITFDKSNSSEDTDELSTSMHNLFSNLGISELVVSSGSSTNSVGLTQSIRNDESFALKFVDRLGSWMDTYIKNNYSKDFTFKFHRVTYFSQKEVTDMFKEASLSGLPTATDYVTSLGITPYEMMNKTYMENALQIKDGLWKPLSTSYTQSSSDNEGGAPMKDDTELSDEGIKTRDGNKNGTL